MHTLSRQIATCLLLVLSITAEAGRLPVPDHVVLVIEENHGYDQIMNGAHRDSFIRKLAGQGMLLTQSHGVTHPSQPNYLALFSGSTQGVTNDDCPLSFSGDNLATTLSDGKFSFASYSESMPVIGDTGCISGSYRRKHNPLVNWQSTPPETNLRFSDFPKDFSKLPTVSFVIPNQDNDMHDGSFEQADAWLRSNIKPYVEWAYKHNSLLILTWDEDNYRGDNRIATILAGPMVKTGTSDQRINHYNLLRTLLDFYGLPALGASRDVEPVKDIWK